MNPLVKDLIAYIAPLLLSGYAAFILTKYKVDKAGDDNDTLRKEFDGFRSYINTLDVSVREQIIIQRLTTTTLNGLVTKLEHVEDKVNEQQTQIAIMKDKRNHGN